MRKPLAHLFWEYRAEDRIGRFDVLDTHLIEDRTVEHFLGLRDRQRVLLAGCCEDHHLPAAVGWVWLEGSEATLDEAVGKLSSGLSRHSYFGPEVPYRAGARN
jgi:hypothetical protein